jgi:hypothetical protein
MDNSPHGQLAPWTARPMDNSPHGGLLGFSDYSLFDRHQISATKAWTFRNVFFKNIHISSHNFLAISA